MQACCIHIRHSVGFLCRVQTASLACRGCRFALNSWRQEALEFVVRKARRAIRTVTPKEVAHLYALSRNPCPSQGRVASPMRHRTGHISRNALRLSVRRHLKADGETKRPLHQVLASMPMLLAARSRMHASMAKTFLREGLAGQRQLIATTATDLAPGREGVKLQERASRGISPSVQEDHAGKLAMGGRTPQGRLVVGASIAHAHCRATASEA